MRVLFATSEATPFIKSGGLADVLGSLPKEMVKKGVESIVVLPKYQDMKLADKIEYVTAIIGKNMMAVFYVDIREQPAVILQG